MSNTIIVWSEMSEKERTKLLDKHKAWARGEAAGQRADLRGAYLQGADL